MVFYTPFCRRSYELRRSGVHGSGADRRIFINTLSQAFGTSLIFKRGRKWRSRLSFNLPHSLTNSTHTVLISGMTIFQLRLRTKRCRSALTNSKAIGKTSGRYMLISRPNWHCLNPNLHLASMVPNGHQLGICAETMTI